jgi:hypothetical protein
MQKSLTLSRSALEVTLLAVYFYLGDMPANRFPPFDLPAVFIA